MLIVPLPHQVQEVEVNGKRPFREWLQKLKDAEVAAAVVARIRRIEVTGGFGDYRYLAEGVLAIASTLACSKALWFFFWVVAINRTKIEISRRQQRFGWNI